MIRSKFDSIGLKKLVRTRKRITVVYKRPNILIIIDTVNRNQPGFTLIVRHQQFYVGWSMSNLEDKIDLLIRKNKIITD
jgi:hypothetical protein